MSQIFPFLCLVVAGQDDRVDADTERASQIAQVPTTRYEIAALPSPDRHQCDTDAFAEFGQRQAALVP